MFIILGLNTLDIYFFIYYLNGVPIVIIPLSSITFSMLLRF